MKFIDGLCLFTWWLLVTILFGIIMWGGTAHGVYYDFHNHVGLTHVRSEG